MFELYGSDSELVVLPGEALGIRQQEEVRILLCYKRGFITASWIGEGIPGHDIPIRHTWGCFPEGTDVPITYGHIMGSTVPVYNIVSNTQ